MPTSYQGVAIPPPNQDQPNPIPGKAPTIQLPVDADAFNAAAFAQPYMAGADYQAQLQNTLNVRKPLTQGSVTGFTAVSQVGSGTGTVLPASVSSSVSQPTSGPYYFVVKIGTPGAVGTATFQLSNDGGNTYATAQTTAATYTDPITGTVIAFSGTFVSGTTYAFQPAFTPQSIWVDSAGNARHIVDHNGFPMGKASEIREEWVTWTGAASSGPITGTIWQINLGSGGTCAVFNTTSTAGSFMGLNLPTTNGANINLFGITPFIAANSPNAVMVMEFDAYLAHPANQEFLFGIANNILGTANTAVGFHKRSTDTNWQLYVDNAGSVTNTDSGIAPVMNTLQRFRLELRGANTPGGAYALFFINEALVGVIASPLTSTTTFLSLLFGAQNTSTATTGLAAAIGPILIRYNRYLSLPVL